MLNKMKQVLFFFASLLFVFACSTGQNSEADTTEDVSAEEATTDAAETGGDNTLSEAETADGWTLLFDGSTSNGWRGYQKTTFPAAWEISEGMIHIQGSGRGEAGAADGGDIVYDKMFSDFHFKVDWMVDSAANSGILYRGTEEFDYIWKTGPEMQVLDNLNHPDAKLGKNGNRQAGSLYDLIPADPQNFKGHGTWNTSEVIAQGANIWHVMNGDTVVKYTIGSDRMAGLIADSKWPGMNPNWGNIPMEGFIALQDHGDDVWYKNIKIKEY